MFSALSLVAACSILTSSPAAGARASQDSPRVWTDFEIVGYDSYSREEIIQALPVKVGSAADLSFEQRDSWARALEEKLGFARVFLGNLRYVDGKSFLVVNVVEVGDEERMAYRDAPTGSVEIPAPVQRVYAELNKIWDDLFEQGTPPMETVTADYVDFSDPAMSRLAKELRDLAGPHREQLIRVVREDAQEIRRAEAASLLNWAGDPEASIHEVIRYLDDPSPTIRNNITRFMGHFLGSLRSETTRHAVLRELSRQVRRPSHGDRNKSLYGMLSIVESHPEDLSMLMQLAGDAIHQIAEQSILSNVQPPAAQLLEMAKAQESKASR